MMEKEHVNKNLYGKDSNGISTEEKREPEIGGMGGVSG